MRVKDAIKFVIDSTGTIYEPGEAESIAFLIVEYMGFPRKEILLRPESEIELNKEVFLRKTVESLKTSRPIQYILGETWFFGLKFRVNDSVLIPRQETEQLVQRIILENINTAPLILDLGTGSGCISITLAKNIPSADVYATDISMPALKTANENAELNKVKITTIADDMLNPKPDWNQKFDIIVSNPPYVRVSEKKFMHKNVLDYEPGIALFVSDENPLEFYKAISQIAWKRLKKGGILYVEINENFGREVAELFRVKGFLNTELINDIHVKNRFVKALRP